jgi:SCY1-like protein 1
LFTLKDLQLSINSIATGTQASTVGYAPSTSSSFDQAAPASARSSVDGWGELEDGNIQEENGSDKEGWDDVDPFDDKPSPSLLSNIQAAQKRPVVQPKQAGKFAFVKCIGLFHAVARSTLIENTSKGNII